MSIRETVGMFEPTSADQHRCGARIDVRLAVAACLLGAWLVVPGAQAQVPAAPTTTPVAAAKSAPAPVLTSAYRDADPEPGYVVGRVLMARDASPVAGAHVAVLWSWVNMLAWGQPSRCVHARYTRTDANGYYRVPVWVGQQLDPDLRVFAPGLESVGTPFQSWGPLQNPPESPDGEPLWFVKPRSKVRIEVPLVKGPFATEEEARQAKGSGMYVIREPVRGTRGRDTRWEYFLTTTDPELLTKIIAGPYRTQEEADGAIGTKNHFMKEVEGDWGDVLYSISRRTPRCSDAGASSAVLVPFFQAQLEALPLVRERAMRDPAGAPKRMEEVLADRTKNLEDLIRDYGAPQ